jgi:RimJ/RimL family protein N-acetyltransferase
MIWVHHSQPGYEALVGFITQRVWGDLRQMTMGTVAAVASGGKVVAAVLFHNWDKASGVIEVSAASDSKRWLSRAVLRELFGYAFNELRCQAVVARIDPANASLARIFTAYGFRRYDLPRMRGREKGEAVLILGDDDWQSNGFHKEYA